MTDFALSNSPWERGVVSTPHLLQWLREIESGIRYSKATIHKDQIYWDEDKGDLFIRIGEGVLNVSDTMLRNFGLYKSFFNKLKPASREFIVKDYVGSKGLQIGVVYFNGDAVGFGDVLDRPRLILEQEINFIAKSWPGDWMFDRLRSPLKNRFSYGFWMINTSVDYNGGRGEVYYPGINIMADPTRMHGSSSMALLYCLSCGNGLIRKRAARTVAGRFYCTSMPSTEKAFLRLREIATKAASEIMHNVSESHKYVIHNFRKSLIIFLRRCGVSAKEHVDFISRHFPKNSYDLFTFQHEMTKVVQRMSSDIEERVSIRVEKLLRELFEYSSKPYSGALRPVYVG